MTIFRTPRTRNILASDFSKQLLIRHCQARICCCVLGGPQAALISVLISCLGKSWDFGTQRGKNQHTGFSEYVYVIENANKDRKFFIGQ